MIRLTIAEGKRLLARRITRFFPLVLAVLIVAGIAIAVYVITGNDDNSVDFVSDLAGGIEAREILGPISSIIPLMAFVIGASYIGADIKTGMLEHLLTWEPRRMRLLGARAVSLFVVCGVLAILLATFLVAMLFVLSAIAGTTDGTTGELWVNVVKAILRAGLAAAIFSSLGIGFTILVNNSIASIVGFVSYWFIIEPLIGTFLPSVGIYLPITNSTALASGSSVESVDGLFSDNPTFTEHHGWITAGVIVAAWSAVALVGGGAVFSRRDIS